MEILVKRLICNDVCTMGEMYINGALQCYTLEDVVRSYKIPGQTAIPAGRYKVVVTYSPAFDAYLPLLLNVPNFEGVRIHTGNTADHTRGCILVGGTQGNNFVGLSRDAFKSLFKRLDQVASSEEIAITIM